MLSCVIYTMSQCPMLYSVFGSYTKTGLAGKGLLAQSWCSCSHVSHFTVCYLPDNRLCNVYTQCDICRGITVVTIMLVGFYIGSRPSGILQTTFCTKKHYNFNIVVLYGSTLRYYRNCLLFLKGSPFFVLINKTTNIIVTTVYRRAYI